MRRLKAKILSNEELGAGFYRMALASAHLAKFSQPGQFVDIRCSNGTDPLLRRPFSVHRIWPGGIEILYEVVGEGTGLLARKRTDEDLDIIGPLGNGFDLDMASDVNILVAGGIGIAPIPALAEKLANSIGRMAYGRKTKSKIYALIGAKTRSRIMCEKEFRSIGAKVEIATDDGSKGYKGFITDLLRKLLATYRPETYLPAFRHMAVYACGPAGMLETVASITREHGITCQVSLEERMACGVGVCLGCPVKVKPQNKYDAGTVPTSMRTRCRGQSLPQYKMVCKDGPVFNADEIAW